MMIQLPKEFIHTTKELMGEERFERYLQSFEEETPVSIRLNPKKSSGLTAIEGELVPWCRDAFYLKNRPGFTFDPLFHAGCYYVQEAASMFLDEVLRQLSSLYPSPVTLHALDLCAAPGGKSTLLRSALSEECALYSNEPMRNRASILLENVTKWGYENHFGTNLFPKDYRKSKMKFDVILCDVPCSGEGMFRKDSNAASEWSTQNVEKCWRLQREIVADAWECLNPGGILIYSTCTFNIKETEENVRWILETYDAEPIAIPTEPEWNITGSLLEGFDIPVYRFIPGITRGEGLFMCALRKGGGRNVISSPPESGGVRGGLNSTSDHLRNLRQMIPSFRPPLTPPDSGGEPPRVDLSYQDALKYLRGEALVLPPDTPKGIVTVTYKGYPLGPVKNIGNRANNLYPKSWRIKTTHLPSEPVEILPQ